MNIEQLIKSLSQSGLVAECPLCSEEFALSDALLFDGMKKFPQTAEEIRKQLLSDLAERNKELVRRKLSAGKDAEKKAIEVGFGKIIEKFIPAYENLKLEFHECRPLYDPIDLIVFNGLLKSSVDFITFLEVKSGNSRLNTHQKMIKEAVNDGEVNLKVL
jgi:predicted Holliday junction resolvase-like endonuclease